MNVSEKLNKVNNIMGSNYGKLNKLNDVLEDLSIEVDKLEENFNHPKIKIFDLPKNVKSFYTHPLLFNREFSDKKLSEIVKETYNEKEILNNVDNIFEYLEKFKNNNIKKSVLNHDIDKKDLDGPELEINKKKKIKT